MNNNENTLTRGIGSFFFFAIPAVLAGAALMWLAFYTGVIDWQKTQRVEGRMDNRVGVNGQLTMPVDLVIGNRSCLKIDRAFLDGDSVTMYLDNQCHTRLDYYEWHWKAVSPDGTTIKENYENTLDGIDDGEKLEKTMSLPDDNRIVKIIVWARNHN